jgi:hypothetical protein
MYANHLNVVNIFLVCDYYVHMECQELIINDCRETAAYGKFVGLIANYVLSLF